MKEMSIEEGGSSVISFQSPNAEPRRGHATGRLAWAGGVTLFDPQLTTINDMNWKQFQVPLIVFLFYHVRPCQWRIKGFSKRTLPIDVDSGNN